LIFGVEGLLDSEIQILLVFDAVDDLVYSFDDFVPIANRAEPEALSESFYLLSF